MSEFVDPIKQVKKKVKFLEEASSLIKGSRRQQLERQREIKGLEVAKTEEYTKQAQPIIEAIGTLPSTEEKRVLKEASRSIVSNELISNSIPKTDPSYNIILKLFDDSYDVIQGRKTQLLKERDINLMVESIQSIVGDVLPLDGTPYLNVYEKSSPISFLAKYIFEKVFFNKDYDLTESQKTDIKLHEEAIQDREKTELEKSALESEAKVEEESKKLEERTTKMLEDKSDEELRKIAEENSRNIVVKDYMFEVFKKNLVLQKLSITPKIKNIFNFIHPELITETNNIIRISKIDDLIKNPNVILQIPQEAPRNKIKNALVNTYTTTVVNYVSSKSASAEVFVPEFEKILLKTGISKKTSIPAPAPADALPDSKSKSGKIEIIGDNSAERVSNFLMTPEILEIFTKDSKGKPINYKIDGLITLVEDLTDKTDLTRYERAYTQQQFLKKYFKFLTDAGKVSTTKEKAINKAIKNLIIPDDFIRTLDTPIKSGRGLKIKKKAEISGKGAVLPLMGQGLMTVDDDPSKIDNYFDETGNSIAIYTGKVFRVMSVFIRRLNREMRAEWSPNDRLYFQIIALQKLIDLHNLNGPSETKDVMISSAKNLIEEKLSEFTNEDYKELAESKVNSISGSGLKKPHSMFEKKMKKKSNEDLLHNLQVHMGEVQAGNTGLKEPIKMILNEAVGRGIMKKQIATKISKNFC
jgi:hypothetical protein